MANEGRGNQYSPHASQEYGRPRTGIGVGRLPVGLHLLMSVTITTEIPGVGGVSRPGEKDKPSGIAGCNMIPNFKSRLSNLYTEYGQPLIRSSNARCGGASRGIASKTYDTSAAGSLSRALSLSLSHELSHPPSLTMPPMLSLFSQNAKEEVYCGIITTHLVISERLAQDGLSMQ